ncbi:hypothetical protein [endosymbiont GvMRE of Glomus versiforme]|uniref:hypothetical protein n=1 Tax=endosymbiont GvMRE of Glomus versiforme TaxID=2039283 RepID=UPI000EBF347B|nr:hypothetical protein [endosymbiont GvMRE of Glomus versiforme]RHZ35713.1 hypothetical protein GvMRE_Ic6g6 [endosymbiont GvMRE of Glomus versiforme]
MESRKQVLSIRVAPSLYQRLKKEVGAGKISKFMESVAERELDELANKVMQEKKEFQKQLIASYKRSARSKTLREEEKIWEEIIEDID